MTSYLRAFRAVQRAFYGRAIGSGSGALAFSSLWRVLLDSLVVHDDEIGIHKKTRHHDFTLHRTNYASFPVKTSNKSPSPCLLDSRSLQKRMMGSHSCLDAGIRPPGGARNALTEEYPFSRPGCDEPRWSTAVGHRINMVVGNESKGPAIDTIDVNAPRDSPCVRHQ